VQGTQPHRLVEPTCLTASVVSSVAMDVRGVRRRGQISVALAALAWSSAGVIQREISVGTATQVAGRAFFAVLALLVYVSFTERGGVVRAFTSMGPTGIAVALAWATASAAFIVGLNHTTVANVLFMQAVSPIAAALIAWAALHERVSGRTALAMVVALAGVGLMVGGPGGSHGLGLGLSALTSLSFALGLVITRHRRDISMAPALCLSQLLVLVVFLPFSQPSQAGTRDLLLMVALGAGQIVLGFVFLMIGVRLIPAAEVALITLLEVVLGPLWVWFAFSERPSTATLLGGAVVVAAVAVQAGGGGEAAHA
jgi:drug/metabolite transporter (DMT)-like permease